MTSVVAAGLVDWDALWKIVLIALCGGVGVTAIFGVAVIRLEAYDAARADHRSGTADLLIAAVCGAVCIAAVVAGLLAVLNKS